MVTGTGSAAAAAPIQLASSSDGTMQPRISPSPSALVARAVPADTGPRSRPGQPPRCKMKRAAIALVLLASSGAWAADRPRIAVFDFALTNTSPAPTTPEERDRLRRLYAQLR